MSGYSEDFTQCARKTHKNFSKVDDACLLYKNTNDMRDVMRYYDFMSRTLTVRCTHDTQSQVIQFRDLDAESLSFMRQKLIELGGTPPALASATTSPEASGQHVTRG